MRARRAAADRVDAINRRPLAGPRNLLPHRPAGRRMHQLPRARRLRAASATRRSAPTGAPVRRSHSSTAACRRSAPPAPDRGGVVGVRGARDALAARTAELDRAARTNWILWIRQPLLEVLPTALLILAGVIFGPPLAKAFLYFVVAPAAARRPPIRLVPDDRGGAGVGDESAASQRVELAPGQELLIVPEALRSTPHEADKATQWLLNWSMPISSLAAGLVALVRIRPRRADFVRLRRPAIRSPKWRWSRSPPARRW